MDKKAFGMQIRILRNEKKMSVDALAEKVGVTASFIREIENGRKLPALPVFVDIANALEVMTDELLMSNTQADHVILNSLTRRMSNLSKDNFDKLVWMCNAMLAQMQNDEKAESGK